MNILIKQASIADSASPFNGQIADIFIENHTLFFSVSRTACPIGYGNVLQITLTALVADRAIQRVVNQQEFHHALLRFNRRF